MRHTYATSLATIISPPPRKINRFFQFSGFLVAPECPKSAAVYQISPYRPFAMRNATGKSCGSAIPSTTTRRREYFAAGAKMGIVPFRRPPKRTQHHGKTSRPLSVEAIQTFILPLSESAGFAILCSEDFLMFLRLYGFSCQVAWAAAAAKTIFRTNSKET